MKKFLIGLLLVGACNLFSKNAGDCEEDADCPGSICVELAPDGFRVCQQVFAEASFCQDDIGGTDECCTTFDCAAGLRCFDSEQAAPVCGGAQQLPHNVCAQDECVNDSDCAPGNICSQPGTFDSPLRRCMPATCAQDRDCDDERDGICAPIEEGCCGQTISLACVYPSDGCRSDADCGLEQICEITNGRASCVTGQRQCPP